MICNEINYKGSEMYMKIIGGATKLLLNWRKEEIIKSYRALNYEVLTTELQLLQQELIPNIDTGYHQVLDWNSQSYGVVILTVLPIPFISEIPATRTQAS